MFDEQNSVILLRRYGIEIEINAFDMLNRPASSKVPAGIYDVACLIHEALQKNVTIHKWSNDHYNTNWILKPDGSCGMEICSPVLKGIRGLSDIRQVVDKLQQDTRIKADSRCSLHVHVDVSDLDLKQVAAILTWWIKLEMFFMDAMPLSRKLNQYCQLIGLSSIIHDVTDDFLSNIELLKKLGETKYFSINTFHYYFNRRKTIEFRIMDHESCLNATTIVNWIILILHFISRSIEVGMPEKYVSNAPLSGYCWLDPKQAFGFLELDKNDELRKIKKWFLERLLRNTLSKPSQGIFSISARKKSYSETKKIVQKFEDKTLLD